jgi:hypothetical protein
VTIVCFTGYQGGALHLDQLTGSCPQVSRLAFHLGNGWREATEASRQRYSLSNLKRLTDLQVMSWSLQTNVDLDLPHSLTQLRFQGYQSGGGNCFDFSWALREAVKSVGRGAQLHRLICSCADAYRQPAQWGASLEEQHRRLGGQLGGLRELNVWGAQEQLLMAVGAVASSAPCLVRLKVFITHVLSSVEVPPICSASLESIRVAWKSYHHNKPTPRQARLTFLPGCNRLQEVVVHFPGPPVEGAAVKIRCHCCSQRCIVPMDGCAGIHSDVIVKFLHMPSSEQGGNDYTVLSECHATGPEQAPWWGRAVMPGIL